MNDVELHEAWDEWELQQEMLESFRALGLSEDASQVAVSGRHRDRLVQRPTQPRPVRSAPASTARSSSPPAGFSAVEVSEVARAVDDALGRINSQRTARRR